MKKMWLLVVSAVLVLATLDCVGTEVGNPPADVDVDFVSVENDNDEALAPLALTLNNGVEITRAVIVVGDLRFHPCGETEDEQNTNRTEPFIADILEPDVVETSVALPSGTYCRLDVRPERGGEDGLFEDEQELRGLTLYAEGTYEGTPLFIRYEKDDEIEFFGRFTIDEQTQRLFIGVEIQIWFDGIDLSTAEIEGDDDERRIVIGDADNGGNREFVEQLSDNFEASIHVAVDRDNDGTLDLVELRNGED